MTKDALVFTKLLEICEDIAAGTKTISLGDGAYVPPWGANSSSAVLVGSEDLAASFVGVLKAHKSEHFLEGSKHMQKVRRMPNRGQVDADGSDRKNVVLMIERCVCGVRLKLLDVFLLFAVFGRYCL
jgi:hypothetical protein